MNSHHIKGAANTVSGKIKVAAGNLVDNRSLSTSGKIDQLKGAAHTGYGNAKDTVANLQSNVKKIVS